MRPNIGAFAFLFCKTGTLGSKWFIKEAVLKFFFFTLRSKLLVPLVTLGLRNPGVVDQRVGFFLDGSSGWSGVSGSPTSAGSLLRLTCRCMSETEKDEERHRED